MKAKIPIAYKFIGGIVLILLAISVFFYAYFPGKIKQMMLENEVVNAKVLVDVVSVGAGIALSSNDFQVLSLTINTAKEFPNAEYIVFLNNDDMELAAFNPGELEMDSSKYAMPIGTEINRDHILMKSFVTYEDEKYGSLLIKYSLENVNATIARYERIILSIAISLLLLGTVFAIILANHVSSPIRSLMRATGRVTHGDLDASVDIKTNDELGVLANTFNYMVKSIKEKAGELEAKNELLESKQEELQQINQELESFSYTVSHDLRAPLRAIDGFAKVLTKKVEGRLHVEEERYLKIIVDNVAKMGVLIDDLLSFSRMGRLEKKEILFDFDQLVQSTYEELTQAEGSEKYTLKIGKLPKLKADREMMKHVVSNLLGNAIKFSSERENPVIEVGSEKKDGKVIYFFKDNGAGFEPEYVDKIFGIFQRLHSDEEFEGTGVGLAIVQRIIHNHNGRVWAGGLQTKAQHSISQSPKTTNDDR